MSPWTLALRAGAVLFVAAALGACGARTGLEVGAADASAVEAGVADAVADPEAAPPPPPPPDCGTVVAEGQLRTRAADIHARPAVGDDLNLYTARRVGETWFAVSLDQCLRERWSKPLSYKGQRPLLMHVAVDDLGDVWLVSHNTLEQWKFSPAGEPLTALPAMDRQRDTWVGLEDQAGPLFSVFRSVEEKWLVRANRNGTLDEAVLPTPSSYVWEDECAVFAGAVTCISIAFNRKPLAVRWSTESPDLIDGTLRHVLPPATDGTRMWTVLYGISRYDLVAQEIATGARPVRVSFMNTDGGQSELLLGPPVVAEDGTVILYRHGSGVPGALVAYKPGGSQLWSYAAARAPRSGPSGGAIFNHDATHLVGQGGLVYLGMGHEVHAVRLADGSKLWRLDGLPDVNEPRLNLSPNGDLYVLDSAGTLYAIATASSGLAASPWPIPGGGHRLAYAR